MKSLGFMVLALTGTYEEFILPFLASTLVTYPEATTEIRVYDKRVEPILASDGVKQLRKILGDRFGILGIGDWPKLVHWASTPRWCIQPEYARQDLTYIGDVDIIISDKSILDIHPAQMEQLGLPYSNVTRGTRYWDGPQEQGGGKKPRPGRLTGLHCVSTAPYYEKLSDKVVKRAVRNYGKLRNEEFLYALCRDNFGLPKIVVRRPEHGVHVSPKRQPDPNRKKWGKMMHWDIPKWREPHMVLAANPQWQACVPFFPEKYRKKLDMIKYYCDHPKSA
jgi:hypothetical protein